MKLDADLVKQAWKDYVSFGMTSVLYLMRKYKLSAAKAHELTKLIDKRSKLNFNAKVVND